MCVLIFYLMYLFDVSGEKINNEWEKLRNALYGCYWMNKPEWFKKVLLIMISCNNSPMEVKPHGLFVLNLRNFATTINATYSYYNILNNFKDN
ncbi:odorant receptor 43a-like [Lycorma delicatula]|uniref:odorant receptor 43a-like n=1 Tax=Lycorma delicatula TaxID=130591 RepID=UPI003F5167D7